MDCSPIDTKHLTDMSGGDTDFEIELLHEFLDCTPPLMADLGKAIEEGNLRGAQISAHTLKGSCRSLGAFPMSNPCEKLESMARNGDLDHAGELYEQVVTEFERVKTFMFDKWSLEAA